MGRLINISALIILLQISLQAQTWYIRDADKAKIDAVELTDKSILVAGDFANQVMVVEHYDSLGYMLWSKNYGNNFYVSASTITATYDGGFLLGGRTGNNAPDASFALIRCNQNGDTLWTKKLSGIVGATYVFDGLPSDVIQNPDSGFTICGTIDNDYINRKYGFYARIDKLGGVIWQHIDTALHKLPLSVHSTLDGGYVFFKNDYIDNFCHVLKYTSGGALMWEKVYGLDSTGGIYSGTIIEDEDSNLIISGQGDGIDPFSIAFLKLNSQGDSLLTRVYSSNQFDFMPSSAIRTKDGGYVCYGTKQPGYISRDFFIAKFDSLLRPTWTSYLELNNGSMSYGGSIIQAQDEGYIMTGYGYSDGIIMKTDEYGKIGMATLEGAIFEDANSNCLLDSNEYVMPNTLIRASGINDSIYTLSDINGHYYLSHLTDTTNYHIEFPNLGYLWQVDTCIQEILDSVNFVENLIINIPIHATRSCTDMLINLSNNFYRRCFDGPVYVDYCNRGTIPATNVYTEIAFDPNLIINTSSVPWNTPQTGNIYRFELGNVNVGECGRFTVNATVNCDSTEIGQTLCNEAHIYPDTICLPYTSGDNSFIELFGVCENNDTIRFEIRNTGGDMTQSSSYYIVEDNVMIRVVPFQLNAGQSLFVSIPANGSTYTILTTQNPSYPGISNPLKTIEACGLNSLGGFSTGYVLDFPHDDQDDFIAIDCHEVIGSFDPNDKQVSPEGLTLMGYISKTQPLEYQIRFQNTGTDTAFTVVVRDTLSDKLDITTLQLGVSDHSYTFAIRGNNVLEWTFNNILLPDSNVNEPASHGFLTFSIDQKASNQPGDVILNSAGIYFDFNAPVITNTTINTVAEDFKQWLAVEELSDNDNNIHIYPNPTEGQLTIMLQGKPTDNFRMLVYDLAGKQVKECQLQGAGAHMINDMKLQQGMYLYRVYNNSTAAGSGKLIILKTN